MSWTPPQRTLLQKIGYSALGWLCLLIGVVGGFVPVMQGWVFVLTGVTILSREHEWAYNFVHRFKNRYPKVGGWMDKGTVRALQMRDRMMAAVGAA
jgi:uncharacterized membrane protein YbaN (DUF454 family)